MAYRYNRNNTPDKNYSPVNLPRALIPFIWGCLNLVVGLIIGGVVGVFIFIRVTGGSGEVSQPISAPTLVVEPTMVVTEAASNDMSEDTQETPQPQVFRIVSEESEARFSVYETYPEGTAVGRTNQIAGDIIVDLNNPQNSQIGTIRINLRSLQTDDPDRDRSIRCCVLLTAQNEYEFTDFVPTSISGLPEQPVTVGDTITFQVTGDLTLRGVAQPVTFGVSVTVNSPQEIRGNASTIVNRTDFNILNDEQNGFDYHGVENDITLEFDFIARAVEN